MQNNSKKYIQGMTMIEMIIVIFIFGIIAVATAQFQFDVLRLSGFTDKTLNAVFNSRQVLKIMTRDLRSATQGATGAYALQTVATSTIVFFSDVDQDAMEERIRYFIDGTDLKRGLIEPSGNPATYDAQNEVISVLIPGVRNLSTQNVFDYYDSDYDGTSQPLSNPSASQVRLVRITVVIDEDPNKIPAPITATTQVSLRNLKDNL